MIADELVKHQKVAKADVLQDFLQFVVSPNYSYHRNMSIKQKVGKTLKVFFLTLLILSIPALLKMLLIHIGAFGNYGHKIVTGFESTSENNSALSFRFYLLLVLIIVAVFEELAFRLALVEYNRKFLNLSVSLVGGYLLNIFLSSKILWYPEDFLTSLLLANPIYPLFLAIPLYLLFSLIKFDFKLRWNNNFRLFFYLSCLGFTLLHLPSLNLTTRHYFFLPMILLHYFVMSVSLGYVRIRYGIFYSIGMHILSLLPFAL
jgi:hypothetical protein